MGGKFDQNKVKNVILVLEESIGIEHKNDSVGFEEDYVVYIFTSGTFDKCIRFAEGLKKLLRLELGFDVNVSARVEDGMQIIYVDPVEYTH